VRGYTEQNIVQSMGSEGSEAGIDWAMTTDLHTVTAIDPGNHSGLTVVQQGKVQYVTAVETTELDTASKILAFRTALESVGIEMLPNRINPTWIHEHGPVRLLVEDQFVGPGIGASLSVVRCAATWQVIGSLMGMRVMDRVLPGTWRATYGLGQHGIDQEVWSRKIAMEIMDERFLSQAANYSDDVLASVLIAVHGALMIQGWEKGPLPSGFPRWTRPTKQAPTVAPRGARPR
jgi:hypothetical protein